MTLDSLRTTVISAVFESLPAKRRVAIESGSRLGPAMLQLAVAVLRSGDSRGIEAFVASPPGDRSALRPGWETRQLVTHVTVGPPSSNDCSPLGVHRDLVDQVAARGFDIFLCAELPWSAEHLAADSPANAFTRALHEHGRAVGVDVLFPFLNPTVTEALTRVGIGGAQIGVADAALSWVPPVCRNSLPCHELSWVDL